MADIHDRAMIAAIGIVMDQKVTATLGPHVAPRHGCQLSNFVRRHARQFAPPSASRQEPRDCKTGEPAYEAVADLGKRLPLRCRFELAAPHRRSGDLCCLAS